MSLDMKFPIDIGKGYINIVNFVDLEHFKLVKFVITVFHKYCTSILLLYWRYNSSKCHIDNSYYCACSRCYAMIVEMDVYIRPISGKRLGKHVPATKITHARGKRYVVYAVRAD
jgi:hypothetical protein